MSVKGQHIRKGEDIQKYQSNPFWDKKEERSMFDELRQGIEELRKERLTRPKEAAKITTDSEKGEKG